MKHLTSRDNPLFKELARLAGSARQRKKSGQTLLDGAHLLAAYLGAGGKPLHVLVNAAAEQDGGIAALLKKLPGVPLTQLDGKLFADLSELKTPGGILALIAQPQPEIFAARSRFALLLEGIQDPGNLGSLLRSAAAAGCDAAFLSAGCADAWSPKVLRAGMGGHFALSIHEAAELPAVTAAFEGAVLAASLTAESSLYDCDLRGKLAFALGNEGAGLSGPLLAAASRCVAIPMPGKTESLNVAAAGAVCLFEALRQRQSMR
ncbi:MAG: RNA methyltransferase [Nitrosomonadales bacterium]|nr:RNA methyltransferase [Nitrosomonadales bacterium]